MTVLESRGEGTIPHNRGYVRETYANINKLEAIPQNSGTSQGCPLWPLLSKTVLEVTARVTRKEKEIKGIQVSHVSLFADDIILPMKILKQNLLAQLSSFSVHQQTHRGDRGHVLFPSEQPPGKQSV